MEFIKKHHEVLIFTAILIVCYLLFFTNMGKYPLFDVDETRYVSMARDMLLNNNWMTLKLNNEFFFEKPPLYFWLVNSCFLLFGQISEAVARIPGAICATVSVLMMYFSGKKVASNKFALFSALILATSFEFLMLARVAILDIVLTAMIIISTLSGFLTFFLEEKKKIIAWYAFYIFSALAVLTKGIPGFIVPFGTLFISYLFAGKVKDIFKIKYFVPGVILFLLITLPWHIAMLQEHGHLFYREYIYKHHIERFVNSNELGRKEPFYFYILVFIAGFLPWTLFFISMLIDKIKSCYVKTKSYFFENKEKSLASKWEDFNSLHKFLALNIVFFIFTFLFFSSSSTKLPTYILPAFAPAAFLLGNYWVEHIVGLEHDRKIMISTIILNSVLVIAAIAAIFTPLYLSGDLLKDVNLFRTPVIVLLFVVPSIGIFASIVKQRMLTFFTNIILVIGISLIGSLYVFNFICKFGENDLINFAIKAKNDKVKLATYDFGRRYSLIYYYEGVIDFQTENDVDWLKKYSSENPSAYVVVKLKNLESFDRNFKYKVVDTGKKYSLVKLK